MTSSNITSQIKLHGSSDLSFQFEQLAIQQREAGSIVDAIIDQDVDAVKQCLVKKKETIFSCKDLLHLTSQVRSETILQLLLESGYPVYFTNWEGNTALHECAFSGFKKGAEMLIRHGIEVEAKNMQGLMACHIAAKKNDISLFSLVCQKIHGSPFWSCFDDENRSSLYHAVESDAKEMVEFLLEKQVSVSHKAKSGFTPLHLAARKDDTALLKLLWQYKKHTQDPLFDSTILHAAIKAHKRQAIEFLLKKGVSVLPLCDGITPTLHLVFFEELFDLLELFLNHGSSIHDKNHLGDTLFILACENANVQVAHLCLSKGVAINETGQNGQTGLHRAVIEAKNEMVLFLLDQLADPKIKDHKGNSVLHYITRTLNQRVISRLIEATDTIDIPDDKGITPLAKMCQKADPVLIEQFFISGASPLACSRYNLKPLEMVPISKEKCMLQLFTNVGYLRDFFLNKLTYENSYEYYLTAFGTYIGVSFAQVLIASFLSPVAAAPLSAFSPSPISLAADAYSTSDLFVENVYDRKLALDTLIFHLRQHPQLLTSDNPLLEAFYLGDFLLMQKLYCYLGKEIFEKHKDTLLSRYPKMDQTLFSECTLKITPDHYKDFDQFKELKKEVIWQMAILLLRSVERHKLMQPQILEELRKRLYNKILLLIQDHIGLKEAPEKETVYTFCIDSMLPVKPSRDQTGQFLDLFFANYTPTRIISYLLIGKSATRQSVIDYLLNDLKVFQKL